MNLKKYYKLAISTAIYPNQGKNLQYPLLGLIGEIGEVAEKIKKYIRDDNGTMTERRKEQIKNELGDVMWYIASICRELKLNFTYINRYSENDKYMTPDKILDIIADMTNCFIELNSMVPFFNNKIYREASEHIMQILFLDIAQICDLYNICIEDVLESNIKKLLDRKSRNVIRGDGDDR